MKRLIACSMIVFPSILLTAAGSAQDSTDPMLQPIAPDYARRWLTPRTPEHVFGNSYLVGFGGLNVALIRTSAGLILIDGAVPQSVRDVEANIRRLGFRIEDVKLILSTEPHWDHAGGLAALARDSGATVVASAWGTAALKRGISAADDPQADVLVHFPAVQRLRVVRDGEAIRLGDTSVTALATPGHTPGSMSWTWKSCEKRQCHTMVFGSSMNPVSGDAYRFMDHPAVVASFRTSFARMRRLKCDTLFTAHPDQAGKARPGATACRGYADASEARLNKRLADERAGK